MTPPTNIPDLQDDRWGGHIPWFYRHSEFSGQGDFRRFFQLLSPRLKRLFQYNEAGIVNIAHFSEVLESETLQRFRHDPKTATPLEIERFFSPENIQALAAQLCYQDPEYLELEKFRKRVSYGGISGMVLFTEPKKVGDAGQQFDLAKIKEATTRPQRTERHFKSLVPSRLGVLESLLRQLPFGSQAIPPLIRDIKRFFVEAGIMLDLRDNPLLIVPLDDPLLQREVLDRLLPRLATRFPQQEQDLVGAYHDLLKGIDSNTVFGNAFKALEEIARQVSGNSHMMLSADKDLLGAFPGLHATIRLTITKLAAHRGDKGGHARTGPALHEMRYLLLSICNIALLFLDYPTSTPSSSSLTTGVGQ